MLTCHSQTICELHLVGAPSDHRWHHHQAPPNTLLAACGTWCAAAACHRCRHRPQAPIRAPAAHCTLSRPHRHCLKPCAVRSCAVPASFEILDLSRFILLHSADPTTCYHIIITMRAAWRWHHDPATTRHRCRHCLQAPTEAPAAHCTFIRTYHMLRHMRVVPDVTLPAGCCHYSSSLPPSSASSQWCTSSPLHTQCAGLRIPHHMSSYHRDDGCTALACCYYSSSLAPSSASSQRCTSSPLRALPTLPHLPNRGS